MTFYSLACKLLYTPWLSNDCDREILQKIPTRDSYIWTIKVPPGVSYGNFICHVKRLCPSLTSSLHMQSGNIFCLFPALVRSSLEHLITDAEIFFIQKFLMLCKHFKFWVNINLANVGSHAWLEYISYWH